MWVFPSGRFGCNGAVELGPNPIRIFKAEEFSGRDKLSAGL
jgi:hypothetical protein